MHLSPVEMEERGRQVISNVPFSHSFIRHVTWNLSQCFLMKQEEDILRGCGKGAGGGASIPYFGCTCMQSSNRVYERFYFICMLLFNSNFPAHLLRADVFMCVCMYVCMYALLLLLLLSLLNVLLFSLTSSSSSSAGTRKVVSLFGEKELLIIRRYQLIVEM